MGRLSIGGGVFHRHLREIGAPMPDQSRREYPWIGLAVAAGEIFFAVYGQSVLSLAIWLQLVIMLGTLAFIAAVIAIFTHPPNRNTINLFLDALVNVQRWAFLWIVRALLGIAVAVLAFVVPPWLRSLGDPCEVATELRVVTGPENVTALQAAADRYVADKSGGGCRNVTVTVTPNSSITGLRQGFISGWLKPGANAGSPASPKSAPRQVAFISPRPDIWIPDTKFAADHVRDYVEDQSEPLSPLASSSKARLRFDGTVGTSPMAVGVFTKDYRSVPSQVTLSNLVSRLRTEQGLQALVRPSPDTSEAALVSTPVLYQALSEGNDPWTGSDPEAEELFNTRGRLPGDQTALQTSDATALLCRFRAAEARGEPPPPGIAVVAPEKVIAAYNHGDGLGTACQGGQAPNQWRLSLYYPTDLPVLDHPFVQVHWPGEYTSHRQSAIDDFRDWLGDDALTRFGFRTGSGEVAPPDEANPLLQGLQEGGGVIPGTVEPRPVAGRPDCAVSLQQALDCYVAARPVTSLSLLIDVSGSMIQLAGPEGERSLLRAQEVAGRMVSGARTRDQIRVRTFSTERPPESGSHTTISGDEERDELQAQIQQAGLAGSDLRLTEAIRMATRELRSGTQSLVVLTDGQVPRSNEGVAEEAPELARRLQAENPLLRIFIVLIGPKRCDEPPVKPLADALGKGSCVDGSETSTEDVADSVISTILWGDQ
jgi:hypothetical protein